VSHDSLFAGELLLRQHRRGYRFSLDAVLLAHFVTPGRAATVIDLGTGCGVIPLILRYRHGPRLRRLIGIEIQTGLAQLARKNFTAPGGGGPQPLLIEGDLREIATLLSPESADLVLGNPPYYPLGSGRGCRDDEADLARHEVLGTLDDFLAAAAFAVKNRGTVAMVYPAGRSAELLAAAERYRLRAKRLQFVYSYPESAQSAGLVLLACGKNAGSGVRVLPPFYVYQQKNGAFSEKMQHFYAPNKSGETTVQRN
jgi:tRNA1Val (adenine37-N6)-methyltransferase